MALIIFAIVGVVVVAVSLLGAGNTGLIDPMPIHQHTWTTGTNNGKYDKCHTTVGHFLYRKMNEKVERLEVYIYCLVLTRFFFLKGS